VARRVDHDEVGDAPKAIAYYPTTQAPWTTSHSIAIRTDQPVGSVADLDPNVPVFDVQTMEGRIERSLGPQRMAMLALGTFAALSLLLAALGVYGVMRYTTGQRTKEIGIRMAMGADATEVVRLVVRQGMAVTLLGLVLGSAAAFALTRMMRGILFGVSPQDPIAFATAIAILAAVALFASYLPARRATRVDPTVALRAE
jgi:ABC-type antimicrobial peptide transport system permease subunit